MSSCGNHGELQIVPSMKAKLIEAAKYGIKKDIIELLEYGVNVNGAVDEVRSHIVRSSCVHLHISVKV